MSVLRTTAMFLGTSEMFTRSKDGKRGGRRGLVPIDVRTWMHSCMAKGAFRS